MPENIIRDREGKFYLVDFGSVKDIYRHTIHRGTTMTGTVGYMPLEQMWGKVCPASDLYSLGCTLLFLLTHKSPMELPQKGLKIDFAKRINVSRDFQRWLAKIVAPIAEDRFFSAEFALSALETKTTAVAEPRSPRPAKTKIVLTQQPNYLKCEIPLGTQNINPSSTIIQLVIFSLFVASVLETLPIALPVALLYTYSQKYKPTQTYQPKLLPATPNSFRNNLLRDLHKKYVLLEINPRTFRIETTAGSNFRGNRRIIEEQGVTADITGVITIMGKGTEDRMAILTKKDSVKRDFVFCKGHIDTSEAKWLAREISTFIDRVKS